MFTATVLLTLGLCIAANVTIFAVVDAILVRSLPYSHPDELVSVVNSYPGAGADRSGASLPNYYDRRVAIKAFASTAIIQNGNAIIGDEGAPRRVSRDRVSPEFFATLGVPLVKGRTFNDAEMFYSGSGVAVLTDEFWHSQFQADPQVLGRTFRVDGQPVTVIGLLPPGFHYLAGRAQFFIPAASNEEDRNIRQRHSNNFNMIARLAPGATLSEAQAQIDALNHQQIADDPYSELLKGARYHTSVFMLHGDHVRDVRPMLLVLQAGVLALLLIGGVNVVNLMLIRASGRAKELAVRQALGASRRHVIREVVLETLLLGLVGGVFGVGLGALGLRLLDVLGTDQLPLGPSIVFDGRVALVALLGALVVGFALAVPVVWFHLHGRLAPTLQTESRGGTSSRAAQRLRHGFIVAQVGLVFALLVGAGMLGLSLKKLMATSPGFQAEHVLTGKIDLPWKNYPDEKTRLAFVDRLLAALRAQPGVSLVGLLTSMPFSGQTNDNATAVEDVKLGPGESIRTHYTSGVAGDYWKALGIPLIEGRFIDDADNHRAERICVIDQSVAQRYWPGKSALGRRLTNGAVFDKEKAVTIVGVVGNVKQGDLADRSPMGAIYFPFQHFNRSSFSVVVRTSLDPLALGHALQKAVLALDPELPLDEVKPMGQRVSESLVARRSPAVLAGIFSAVALLLAAVGTYGVLAYAVNQRRREIGVRMALGAQPQQVRNQFLGLGATLLAIGLGLGLLAAWGVGRSIQNILFDVGALNLGVIAAATVVMSIIVLVAVYVPSRRAAHIDPLDALRDD